jgi:hypothetical protein
MVADELRRQADHFIDLAGLEKEINRIRPDAPGLGNGKKRRTAPAAHDLTANDGEDWLG